MIRRGVRWLCGLGRVIGLGRVTGLAVVIGLGVLLGFGAGMAAAQAEAPAERVMLLRRGINVTNWFRYPPNQDPAAIAAYLSDAAMARLRRVGFTVVRLPVQPAFLLGDPRRLDLLQAAIVRLERHGLAVIVAAQPDGWRLETNGTDRAALVAFWTQLAPVLRPLDPRLTFAELLNEPVFPGMPDAWRSLQHALLLQLRAALPQHSIVLTGNDWGSIAGLLALRPETDPNVIYSFHFYDPAELTSLAAYRPSLDHAAFARLPFPADDRAACFATADETTDPSAAALMRFYCGLHWDERRVAERIASAAAWGRRNHATVLLGEFGASAALGAPARGNWLATVRRQAEATGIGWVLWGYDDVMGFALSRPPPPRPALAPAVLRALGLEEPP